MNVRLEKTVYKLVLSAMFAAIGIVLPFFTGQIKEIGNLLLPMHLPVFLCGLICGWQYGMSVGLALPLLRSLLFGMPHLYPNAVAMSAELMIYGLTVGMVYHLFKRQNIFAVYVSMISAMLFGRSVWGIVEVILLGIIGDAFTWQMFVSGAFIKSLPGIILQLILVPAIMSVLNVTGFVKYKK